MCLSCLFSEKSISLILFFLVFVSGLFQKIINPYLPPKSVTKTPVATSSSQLIRVTKVVDGDTIKIETKQKLRYIGIDAPELHDPRKPVECFAKQAFEKNKELVEGKTVKLEKDVSETDKYGRLLRYVFIENDPSTSSGQIFINEYLVAQGYALASSFPPDIKYAQLFETAQQKAKEENLGLWKECH